MEAPVPTDKTRMRSFLGGWKVYLKFVPGFPGVRPPLNPMLRKYFDVDWYAAAENELDAFEKFKRGWVNPLVRSFPNRGFPHMVYTDVIKYELGTVLI